MILSILVNLPFAALEIFAPKFLASLMLNDPTVISYTCIFLPLTGIALFPLGWLFVFRNACQGMGKTVLPMISGVVEVVMRVGIVQIAVPHFAFRGVAFAEISACDADGYVSGVSGAAVKRCFEVKIKIPDSGYLP